MEPTFTIAEVSRKAGLSQDTIRYYEKIQLLPPSVSTYSMRIRSKWSLN
ncbi:MerR family DNA-binding transcriptional regulator [Paenibacillus sp. Root444D2]|nr:MerR family DNA-binding transcriptional regulator [Paenibacillus sp. Root444D2]